MESLNEFTRKLGMSQLEIIEALTPMQRWLAPRAFFRWAEGRELDDAFLAERIPFLWSIGFQKWRDEEHWLPYLERLKSPSGLPKTIQLYRTAPIGVGPRGFSWTTILTLARSYALLQTLHRGEAMSVWRAEFPSEAVVMLLEAELANQADEYVVDPRQVAETNPELVAEFTDCLALMPIVEDALAGQHHGDDEHSRCVTATGLELARATPGSDPFVPFAFGLFHDCENEASPEHGKRAAARAREALMRSDLGTPSFELEIICHAIEHYAEGSPTDHPMVGICWDAELLHIKPDSNRFSTSLGSRPEARELATRIRNSPPTWEQILSPSRSAIEDALEELGLQSATADPSG